MEVVDANGNMFGIPGITVTGPDGKPKTTSGGGSPTGPAGGDLSGTYPNPGVVWANGLPVYNLQYYPLSTNPSGYLTSALAASTYYPLTNPSGYLTGITSGDVTTALGYTPVDKAGDTMLGNLILNTDPTSPLGAATKQYVDNVSVGINFHEPVHAATTGNLSATYLNGSAGVGATLTATSNGAIVVDGHTLLTGERVMVWQQSSGFENGIYDVTDTGSSTTPFILTRSSDADNSPSGELAYGDFCFVQQGATYGGFGFIMNTPGTVTIGVTNVSYVQFNAAQAVTAGYGLQELTPNVLSVDSSVIATVASLSAYLTAASAAATYYPLTNPSGYITGITSSDVTTALGYTPYDSSNPSGYITSAALSPYLTSALAATTYASLTGSYNDPSWIIALAWSKITGAPAFITGITSSDVTTALGYTPVTNARTISTTAPLAGGGDLTANRTLSINQATTSTDGYLSSTDWNTFNNKTRQQFNNSTGTQAITANTVTYLTNSAISTTNIKAGTVITWNISVTKTAAGTAAPAWTVRFGTNASTADTTILTFTGAAQTAAVDTGMITIQCVFRTVGSGTSAVLVGHYSLVHQLDQTGLSTGGGGAFATSAGFNSTTANAFLGITVNTGASAVWTVNQVFVKIENIQ